MKKLITGIMLLSLSFSTIAESSFITEALIGQSNHEVISKSSTSNRYNSSVDGNSLAFRVGYKYNDNFSFELAFHDHGEVTNQVELRIPTTIPGSHGSNSCCLGPEHDTVYNVNIPLEMQSIRLGVKGQWPIYKNLSINARFGIAKWAFGDYSPKVFNQTPASIDDDGNDLYYGLGLDYQFTENFYIGVEYSILSIDEDYKDENNEIGSYTYDVKDLSLVLGWAF
jgi:opacity protein-like surface antigen